MVNARLAWLLWKQRIWLSFQHAILSAVLIVAAVAISAWLSSRYHELSTEKEQIAVSLVIDPSVSTTQAHVLAKDLQAIAPELIRRIDVMSDSALAARLQSRYGIMLSDIAQDSLLPRLLRVQLVPAQVNRHSFTAFIEQCQMLPEVVSIHYPISRVTEVFEHEQRLRVLTLGAGIGWLLISGVILWLHLRATLPLDRRESRTVQLLGATPFGPRRVRTLYTLLSLAIGVCIAAAVVSTAWALHLPLGMGSSTMVQTVLFSSGAVVVVSCTASLLIEPS